MEKRKVKKRIRGKEVEVEMDIEVWVEDMTLKEHKEMKEKE